MRPRGERHPLRLKSCATATSSVDEILGLDLDGVAHDIASAERGAPFGDRDQLRRVVSEQAGQPLEHTGMHHTRGDDVTEAEGATENRLAEQSATGATQLAANANAQVATRDCAAGSGDRGQAREDALRIVIEESRDRVRGIERPSET
jgi:hypothetical protein